MLPQQLERSPLLGALGEWLAVAERLLVLSRRQCAALTEPDSEQLLRGILALKEEAFLQAKHVSERVLALSRPGHHGDATPDAIEEARLRDDIHTAFVELARLETEARGALEHWMVAVRAELNGLQHSRSATGAYASVGSAGPRFLDQRR